MRSEMVKGVIATTLGVAVMAGVIMARPAHAQDDLPAGPGKDALVAACSGCHGLGQVTSEHKTADQWADTVTLMVNNGAEVPEADFDKVVGYLATNFGPAGAAAPAAGGTAPAAAPAGAAPAPATPAPADGSTTPPAGGTAPAPAP